MGVSKKDGLFRVLITQPKENRTQKAESLIQTLFNHLKGCLSLNLMNIIGRIENISMSTIVNKIKATRTANTTGEINITGTINSFYNTDYFFQLLKNGTNSVWSDQ
ncbi:Hypothetical_protein [Hexamita inflata]|uniref:Hypothetical_protein n=1 Tax=Hexamita inflata TaxID=28002 RepID=A0AA86NSW4_9EUKA|nr:Hypothetical protein HINF_LOCUS12486 [Hexamita inflata]